MADEIYEKKPKKPYGERPDLNQIAEHIEDHASRLQETGWTKDAADLVKWARELRLKSSVKSD